ncbi:MAG: histidine triad nucleotide-binding protein [Acidobacteriota bacterium]|nr:histidine triad nucleotide-binding protein [Acidobacteriota bacterium]MDH3784446.1 histidine triad nucleotide-binding protein [Acidobacteriota bacterium]
MSEVGDCLFCRIVAGEIPASIVYEDDQILAFRDIAPQAPTHLLVIPRKHIPRLDDTTEDDGALLGRVMLACAEIARREGVSEAYRVVNNCGADAGQSVFHLHFHLLAGRDLGWPPG